MLIKKLLSYALIAALVLQPQVGNALAPKSFIGDDKTLKDAQTRYLGDLVAEFHAKYAPPRKSKKGKEAPWQSPGQDAIKGLEAAARQLWDDTSLVLSMDAERKAIVFTGESGSIYILSELEPIAARDEKIAGTSLKASAKKIPEKIGPYYARAYESAPDLGERMVSRRAFAKAVAKGSLGMVLAAILGRKAARKVTQWYNRHFGTTAKTGGLYVLFGLHDTIENMKKNFDVLEDEFLPNIPEQDGRPKAIAVVEVGLDVETLFAEFKKKFPEHQDLSIWDIIVRKELRGEIKKLYEEEMQKAHALVEAIVPDPARYEKDQMHHYMAARFKSLGMRVVLESTPFEIWFSDIPIHLDHKPAFDKKDFNLFLQMWAARLMALVGERKGRDVALRGLVKQLLDDNPGTSVVTIRGDRHSLNSDVIAVQGRPFQSVLNTDAAIMNNSAYWICKEWEKLERASDDQKRLALHKFIVRVLIESVLMEGGLVDNLGQAIVVTRQAMEKIEKGDTTWENWVRKRFADSKNEMEMGEWLINDMVGSGTFKLDPNSPQGVHKILFGGTLAASHPEEKPVPAGEIPVARIPVSETDRQTIATMAVGQAISRVLQTAPSLDDAQVLKTSLIQELQKLGVTVPPTEGPVLEFSMRIGEEAFSVKMDLTQLRAASWEDSRVPRGKVLAFAAMPVQVGGKTTVLEYRDRDEIPDGIWTNRKVVKAASPSNIVPVDSQENTGMTFYGAPDGFVVPTPEEFSEEIAALEGEISKGDFAKRGLSKTFLVAMLALSSALTACAPPSPARIVTESAPETMGNVTPADTWVIRTNMANDPDLARARLIVSPRIEVGAPGLGENAPYRVSVLSSDATSATTLGTFNVVLPLARLTDTQPVRRFEAASDGSALAAMVRYSKDGHDRNFRAILFGSDQKPLRQFDRPGRSAEDVKQMRVITTPLGTLLLLLYADNTLEVLNSRNGVQLSFKIRMQQQVGSLFADIARFTLYARSAPESQPLQDDEILEKIELFPAMLAPGHVAEPFELPETGRTPPVPAQPSSRAVSSPTTGAAPSPATTSLPATPIDTSPTSTVPLADGGRVDFEERNIGGATILCAVVRHSDGSEKFAPIPIRFGEGAVHAELMVRDPRSLVIVRGMERQVLDLTNGRIFVRTENIKLAGQIRSGVWPSNTRFYQTERYIVTEDVREGDPEKKYVEKFWLRDLRSDGNRQVVRINEFLDQQLYEGRVRDLGPSFYGYASIFYGNYQVKAFPISTLDWKQSLQVVQLHTLDGRFLDQVVLQDDSGESSGILLMVLNKNQFNEANRERPDILHFQPYTFKEVNGPLSPDALGFDLSKFFTRTLKDLFPGWPGLEPPGVLQSVPIAAGTVELERGMVGNLHVSFRKPQSREPLFLPVPIAFGDGEVRLEPIEGQEVFVQILRGNERQIVDTSTGRIFVGSSDFALYGTPLYTVSESMREGMPSGQWLVRSGWWKNEAKLFALQNKQERSHGQYKIVTAALISADGLYTLSVVQLRDKDGKFIEQAILGPDSMALTTGHEYTGVAQADTGVPGRPDLFRFIPQERITSGGNTRVVGDTSQAFERTLQELFRGRIPSASSGTAIPAGLLQALRLDSSKTAELWRLENGSLELRISGLAPIPISAPVDPSVVRLQNGRLLNTIHVLLGGDEYQIIDTLTGKARAPLSSDFTLYETDRYSMRVLPRSGKTYEVFLWDKTSNAKEKRRLEFAPATRVHDFAYGDYRVRIASILDRISRYDPTVVGRSIQWEDFHSMVVVQLFDKEGLFLKQEILEPHPGDTTNAFQIASYGPVGDMYPGLIWMTPSPYETWNAYIRHLKDIFPEIIPEALPAFLLLQRNKPTAPAILDIRISQTGHPEIVMSSFSGGATKAFPLPFAGANALRLVEGRPNVVEVSGAEDRTLLNLDTGEFFIELENGFNLFPTDTYLFTRKVGDADGSSLFLLNRTTGVREPVNLINAFKVDSDLSSYRGRPSAIIVNFASSNGQRSFSFVQLSTRQSVLLGPDGVDVLHKGIVGIAQSTGTQYPSIIFAAVSAGDGRPDYAKSLDRTLRELFPDVPELAQTGLLQTLRDGMSVNNQNVFVQLVGKDDGAELLIKNEKDGSLIYVPVKLGVGSIYGTNQVTKNENVPGLLNISVDGVVLRYFDLSTGQLLIQPPLKARAGDRDVTVLVLPRGNAVEIAVNDADGRPAVASISPGAGTLSSRYEIVPDGDDSSLLQITVDGAVKRFLHLDSGQLLLARPLNVQVNGRDAVVHLILSEGSTEVAVKYLADGALVFRSPVRFGGIGNTYELGHLQDRPGRVTVTLNGNQRQILDLQAVRMLIRVGAIDFYDPGQHVFYEKVASNGSATSRASINFNLPAPYRVPTATFNVTLDPLFPVQHRRYGLYDVTIATLRLAPDDFYIGAKRVALVQLYSQGRLVDQFTSDLKTSDLESLYAAGYAILSSESGDSPGTIRLQGYERKTIDSAAPLVPSGAVSTRILEQLFPAQRFSLFSSDVKVNNRDATANVVQGAAGLDIAVRYTDGTLAYPPIAFPLGSATSSLELRYDESVPGELKIIVDGDAWRVVDLDNGRILPRVSVSVNGTRAVAEVEQRNGAAELTVKNLDGSMVYGPIVLPANPAGGPYQLKVDANRPGMLIIMSGDKEHLVLALAQGRFVVAPVSVKVRGRDAIATLQTRDGHKELVVKFSEDGATAFPAMTIDSADAAGLHELKYSQDKPDQLGVYIDNLLWHTVDLDAGRFMLTEGPHRLYQTDQLGITRRMVAGTWKTIISYRDAKNGSREFILRSSLLDSLFQKVSYGAYDVVIHNLALDYPGYPMVGMPVVQIYKQGVLVDQKVVDFDIGTRISFQGNNLLSAGAHLGGLQEAGIIALIPFAVPERESNIWSLYSKTLYFEDIFPSINFDMPANVLKSWRKSPDHGQMQILWNETQKSFWLTGADWGGGALTSDVPLAGSKYVKIHVLKVLPKTATIYLELKNKAGEQLLDGKRKIQITETGYWHAIQVEIPEKWRNDSVHYIAFSDLEGVSSIDVRAIILENKTIGQTAAPVAPAPAAKITPLPSDITPETRLDAQPAGGVRTPGVAVKVFNMGDQPPKVSGVSPVGKDSALERFLEALEKNPSDAVARNGVLKTAMGLKDESTFLAALGRVEGLRQKATGNAGLLPLQKGLLQGLLQIYRERKDWQSALDVQAALFALAETRVEQREGLETIARLFKSRPQANKAKAALVSGLQLTPPGNAAEVQRSLDALGLDAGKIYRLATDQAAEPVEEFDGLMMEAWDAELFGNDEEAARLYVEAQKLEPNNSAAAAGHARALIGIGLEERMDGNDKNADADFAKAAEVLRESLLQRDPLHPGTLAALAELYQAVYDEKMMARIAFAMLRRHPGHLDTHKVLYGVWQSWFNLVRNPLPVEAKSALLSGFATILSNTEDPQTRWDALHSIARVLARDGNETDKKNAGLAKRIAKQKDISKQTVDWFLNEKLQIGDMSLGPDAEASVVSAIESMPENEFLALTLDVYALVLGRPMENLTIAALIACGDDAFSQAKREEAGMFYQAALKRDSSRTDVAVKWAASLIKIAEEGRWDSEVLFSTAGVILATALRVEGASPEPETLETAALLYSAHGNFDKAFRLIRKIVRDYPGRDVVKIFSLQKDRLRMALEPSPEWQRQMEIMCAILLLDATTADQRSLLRGKLGGILLESNKLEEVQILIKLTDTPDLVKIILERLKLPSDRASLAALIPDDAPLGLPENILPPKGHPALDPMINRLFAPNKVSRKGEGAEALEQSAQAAHALAAAL